MSSEITELYRKHRPDDIRQVLGQKEAIQVIAEMGRAKSIPHFLLFSGPSGCGKTTLARILRKKLQCSDTDFMEVNAAEDRGIEMVREINTRMSLAPVGGKCRIWLVDEAHQLTPQAQESFLKILEDTPKHVYIFFATTDPQKLKKTILTRATEIRCKELTIADLEELIKAVVQKEGAAPLTSDVVTKIAAVSEGSARKALVILNSVFRLTDAADQMAAIEANDVKGQAIQIARALMNKGTTWDGMRQILASVDDDPESIRHMVLGYCTSTLLKSGNSRAAQIIEEFRDHWYDCKRAGLVVACYNLVKG